MKGLMPFREFVNLEGTWDDGCNFWSNLKPLYESVRVHENENTFFYTLDVPGFNKDNISIEVKEGILFITGERNNDLEGTVTLSKEFNISSLEYDNIKAKIEDGILTLIFEKRPKDTEGQKITIE